MAYPGRITDLRWELRNGVTGTFVIDTPNPEMITAMVTALQNGLTVHIPEITVMPEIVLLEVNYSIDGNSLSRLEVWFKEPDGST